MSAGGRILIINDDPKNRRRLETWLAQQGYDYIFANSVGQAAALLEHRTFDAVLYAHEFQYPPAFMGVGRAKVAVIKFPDVLA